MDVDREIELLKYHIERLGEASEEGGFTIKFGVLFRGKFYINIYI